MTNRVRYYNRYRVGEREVTSYMPHKTRETADNVAEMTQSYIYGTRRIGLIIETGRRRPAIYHHLPADATKCEHGYSTSQIAWCPRCMTDYRNRQQPC